MGRRSTLAFVDSCLRYAFIHRIVYISLLTINNRKYSFLITFNEENIKQTRLKTTPTQPISNAANCISNAK